MSKSKTFRVDLDLRVEGTFFDFIAISYDEGTFSAFDAGEWGSAVVEIKRLNGGVARSHTTPQTLDGSTDTERPSVDLGSDQGVRIQVTTADATKSIGYIDVALEGKD